jgi:hypothetical protein
METTDSPPTLAEVLGPTDPLDWADRNTFLGLTNATAMAIIGVAVVALGFVLIVIGWAEVAREYEVYRQLPYMVSADVGGLAFVIMGATILNISAKRRDAEDDDARTDRLAQLIAELRAVVERAES